MYDNENVTYRVGINWKDLIIKIIMLVLFILLLLWLFPKANLDVFYDTVYTNNIKTMKDAARNYYTVDRLPANVGDQSSMTLKEMIDNKMIIRFTDKNGEKCDESSSKVEVTKIANNEYTLKVKLDCGDQQDYILETIGCTTVCSNGTCQTIINNGNNSNNGPIANNNNNNNANSNTSNDGASENVDEDEPTDGSVKDEGYKVTVILYQHKKKITTNKTVYSCPAGYNKKGTKCYKDTIGAQIPGTPIYNPDQVLTTDAKYTFGEDQIIKSEPIKTETGINYTCPEGYTKNGAYCIKYKDATEKPGDITYTCPADYTKNGTKCEKTYDAKYVAGATKYTCPNGGTLSGTTCTLTTNATSTTDYTCPSGYSKNGTSCYKAYAASANTSYSCPAGYSKQGNSCVKTYTATANTSYSCPSGYSKQGNSCVKTYTASSNTTYSCPNGGTLSGSTCTKSSSYNAHTETVYGGWVSQGTRYYQSAGQAYTGSTSKLVYNGAISGAVCGSPCGNKGIWYRYTAYTRSASTKYSCPSGGSLSGSKCYKNSSYNATASTSYSCPNGGSRNGSTCTLTTSPSSNTTYTCPNGGSRNGSTCTLTTSPSSNTTYTCPNGGTLSGSTCTLTVKATANTTYTCPAGYTKNGTSCYKTYNATAKEGEGSYTCPNGGTLNGKTCKITIDATKHQGESSMVCPTDYTYNPSSKKCEQKINATANPIYSYTCKEGFTAKGEGANMTCEKVISGEKKYYCEDGDATLVGDKCQKVIKGEITGYTCPPEYKLDGKTCIKRSSIVIDANVTTTQDVSYRYKWSEKKYLEGWTFTGKTKKVVKEYNAGQR